MKVLILGSGVVGTASAYFLARQGMEVTVLERQPGAGLETSFGNAGEISPGYASPWAGPGMPAKALGWMLQPFSPLVVRARIDPAQWRWLLGFLVNCNGRSYAVNKERMLRLAEYSRDVLVQLRRDTGIAYDERSRGTLQLFRTQRQLDACAKDTAVLDRHGVPYRVLDAAGCVRQEPALARVRERVAGGLLLPKDETGDCFKFTARLAELAKGLGVRFEHGVRVERLLAEGGQLTGVLTSQGELRADRYLVALGSYSPLLLRPLGIHLPVFPVKGYSLTAPIRDAGGAPESTVMDESFKVAITRLGDRIRIGGTAELAGYDLGLRAARRAALEHSAGSLFPDGADLAQARFWCGLRPMTPDGPPVLGPTPYSNLFLNTGHGTLGWTMACGSGRVLADLLAGGSPEIGLDGLTVDRYRGRRPPVAPARMPA
jgi:D-amino-acid dehydrogenase